MARILLVEDEPTVLKLLSRALESKGYEYETATNGAEGIIKFTENAYDVIVTDIIMPGGDGIGFIEEIFGVSPEAKILAISGGGSAVNFDFLEAARRLGVTATLSKPFELAEFYVALDVCLGTAQPGA
jgi:CheY-like chemotaxis protein